MKNVKVSAGYGLAGYGLDGSVEETQVGLMEAGDGVHAVLLGDERIGYVWKGTRTYSPPTHKGSRIVKYHKKVSEWQGGEHRHNPRYRRDTRQEVLRDLIAAFFASSDGSVGS